MALVNVKRASEIIGLDRQTIINWAHGGMLPFKKVRGNYYVEEDTLNGIIDDLKEIGRSFGHLESLKKIISDEDILIPLV